MMQDELIKEGFRKEPIYWSFRPRFYDQSSGDCWIKEIPYENGRSNLIEIGILINEQYKNMEVYACDCVVSCCGRDMGIHPFSIDKINEIIQEEITFLNEVYAK